MKEEKDSQGSGILSLSNTQYVKYPNPEKKNSLRALRPSRPLLIGLRLASSTPSLPPVFVENPIASAKNPHCISF
jgi:hypothetical protein